MTRFKKGPDGKYLIKGKKYEIIEGRRAKEWHGTAYEKRGRIKKHHLRMNKHGYIVSISKSNTAAKEKRLEKAGYFTKKGKVGYVKKNKTKKRKHNSRKNK